jgi:predicted SAM-dependent methyltransferase
MAGIAYGILCHQSAKYVREQFELLFSPDAWFFYHVDLKAPNELKDCVGDLALTYSNVSVLPSTFCAWGGFSLTAVMIKLVSAALQRGSWRHLIFLSEQHLPLQNYHAIASSLSMDHNYLEQSNFRSLPAGGQQDIRSRFSQRYIELLGVGSFGTTCATPAETFFDDLCHGSQWMTFCRLTCEQIPDSGSDYFEPFRHSVLSDETALQTFVGRAINDDRVVNEDRNLTFVASPSRGGFLDMTFDDRLFLAARDAGYLFIRKRPAVLSELVCASVKVLASTRRGAGAVRDASVEKSDIARQILVDWLNRNVVKGIQFVPMPSNVLGPALFCEVRHADLRYPFAVYVLSEDLRKFKVIAVLHQSFLSFEDSMISFYRTTVVRMRCHDISLHREIHLGTDCCDGYYEVNAVTDFVGLLHVVQIFVGRTAALVPEPPRSKGRTEMPRYDDILTTYLSNGGPYCLELGAGHRPRAGWLATDISPRADGIMKLDACEVFQIPDECFNFVYSQHMIEHIGYSAGLNMIRECYRILAVGGVLRLVTPSIGFIIKIMSADRSFLEESYLSWSLENFCKDAPARLPSFFFNNFVRGWSHTFVYDRETLTHSLNASGFGNVIDCRISESVHSSLRDLELVGRMPAGFLDLESMIIEATKL